MSARLLVAALREPASGAGFSDSQWNGAISAARAERLLATLAHRLGGVAVPAKVAAVFADARMDAEREKRQALWEADRAQAALTPLGIPVILLKGAAYAAADLEAGRGRMIGDLDILVPRDRLDDAERALLAAGWEWVKPDPYDDFYYRRWMHELPPLIHRERDRMIDVHHTILPLTARIRPDADALIADSCALSSGLRLLSPEDRACHAVAHMLADGDLSGGLRNIWDIKCLISDIKDISQLEKRASLHGLDRHLVTAQQIVADIFGEGPSIRSAVGRLTCSRLLSRDEWGRDSRKWLGLVFYIRSHLLRMPLPMLVHHLWIKWRKGHRPV